MKIIKGSFKTARLAYSNHLNEVMDAFLSNGWAVRNTNSGDKNYLYITFEAGPTAKDVKIDFPNAHIL